MSKPKVLLLGKLPPPHFGPAIATKILLNSGLKEHFQLIHVSTKLNDSVAGMGGMSVAKVFKLTACYFRLILAIVRHNPKLVVIPISQTRGGFAKDAPFISLSWLFGKKVLLQLRGSDFKNWMDAEKPSIKKWVEKQLRRSFGMVVLGENLRYLFESYYPKERIYVVPNGGDYEFPTPVKKDGKVNLLYLSNLLETKGAYELLQGIHQISDLRDRFSCKLIGAWGTPAFEEKCREYIKTNHVPVEVYPPIGGTSKMQEFANADVFVFPPNAPEGHPWAIVEAMAAELPIVSTNQGAIVESVVDGHNGFIVGSQSPDEIAQALRTLVLDADKREEMARNSRKRYEEKFTEARMVTNYTGVFNDIIAAE